MKSRLHHSPKCDSLKCVQITQHGLVERLGNEQAHAVVRAGKGNYTNKKAWKAQKAGLRQAAE